MRVSLNINNVSFARNGAARRVHQKTYSENDLQKLFQPFAMNKKAKIPALNVMKGINPNNNDVFDTFTKIDDAALSINFKRGKEFWNSCLLEEIEEFNVARREYESNKTQQNYDHMEEEMGDIFFTAASIAKDSGIDAKEAFKATNRKFFNRINIMERMVLNPDNDMPENIKDCMDYERRALWNAAKRKLYDAQSRQYLA